MIFLLLCAAYLIGSIPTGWLIARALGVSDIKAVGSGNIGATNVARVCGWQWFLIVFFLDAAKAYFFLFFAALYAVDFISVLFIATAILLGNTRSIFLYFRGGKGIATFLGLFFFLQPVLTFFLIAGWFIFLTVTKTVGIASVGMMLLLPIICLGSGCSASFILFTLVISAWIIWLHKKNIYHYLCL